MNMSNPGGVATYHTGLASTGGPQAITPSALETGFPVDAGTVGRYDQAAAGAARHKVDDFMQPRAFYTRVLSNDERGRLVDNISGHLKDASPGVQFRFLTLLGRVDEGLRSRVEAGVASITSGMALPPPTGKAPAGLRPVLRETPTKDNTTLVDACKGGEEMPPHAGAGPTLAAATPATISASLLLEKTPDGAVAAAHGGSDNSGAEGKMKVSSAAAGSSGSTAEGVGAVVADGVSHLVNGVSRLMGRRGSGQGSQEQ